MKHIVLFGAGKSATCLIDYLLKEATSNGWRITVCDSNLALAQAKTGSAEHVKAVSIPVENDVERNALIQSADIVISLLPPELHFTVAKNCVACNKNFLTASYTDENTKSLAADIENKGLLFLCEMGLDPGIDHMSAMKLITSIKNKGGKIHSFISHCGGLVAPESDNNPWHYKITWNPRNVVLAGKEGAVYRKDNKTINVPYRNIFINSHTVAIPGLHNLSWYPNRDSLHYVALYGLDDIATFIRTTLRYPSFMRGWNKLVGIGCTSTSDYEQIKHCGTFEEWFNSKVNPFIADEAHWNNYLQLYITDPHKEEFRQQVNFLCFYSKDSLPGHFSCSADILQSVLEEKLVMEQQDKDMIVMLHEIEYEPAHAPNGNETIQSAMIVKGDDRRRTAMAKTVGLPLGIAAKLILQEKIRLTGLHIPIVPEVYEPVLQELQDHGIVFNDHQPVR